MHHYQAHHHHSLCNPWAQYLYHHPAYLWPYIYAQFYHHHYCPVCCQPYHLCFCATRALMKIPKELSADPSASPMEALIGGLCDVKLTLEYMPVEGATAPSVTITITGIDGTSTWEETSIPPGYHVKNDFSTISPGAKVKIEVTEVTSRLRWCEAIRC